MESRQLCSRRRKTTDRIIHLILLFGAVLTSAAESVRIGWDPNSESNLAGYKLYRGTTSGNYPTVVNVGLVTSREVQGLVPGVTYYFVVTAYNTASLESLPSVEVVYQVPLVPNEIPIALPAFLSVNEDGVLPIVLSGSDPDGDALTFSVTQSPSNGALTGTPPNVSYRPDANFAGSDSFKFTVRDGLLTSLAATVSITVLPVNDAPTAFPGSVNVSEDGAAAVILTGSDPEGSPLSFNITQLPANGTLSGTAPNLTYTPDTHFSGTDSIRFTVRDGALTSAQATVSITVNSVNDAPTAFPASVAVVEEGSVSITLSGSDPEGGALTFNVTQNPAHGTLSGTPPTLTYRPAQHYTGTDTFRFTARDATLTSAQATVTIRITPVNDAPAAIPGSVTVAEDGAVAITLTGTDPEGTGLTYTVSQSPANGTLSGVAPNLTYRPDPDFFGADLFKFTVRDGSLTSAAANVSITVTPVNDAPIAIGDSTTVAEDAALAVTLSGLDPEDDNLTFTVTQAPTKGVLTGTSPNLVYRPNTNSSGTDSFKFTARDATLTSAAATIAITVTPVNDAPTAFPVSVSVTEDGSVPVTLTGSDPEGNPLTYSVNPFPANGTLSGTLPNLTYQPDSHFFGSDTFRFTVRDGALTSAPATVTITVSPSNDRPVAFPGSATVAEDGSVNLTLAGSDTEGRALTFAITQAPADGTLTGTPPNLTYRPDSNFFGTDTFRFTVRDGSLTSAAATFTITITPVNDAPTALANAITLSEDTSTGIALSGSDPEGSTLTFTVSQPPINGDLSGTPPNVIYRPDPNFAGVDSFKFTVRDGSLTSPPATISLVVTPVNDAPTALAASITVPEDTSFAFTLSGTDPEGNSLTFTVTQSASEGVLSGTPPNLVYRPNNNYVGADSLRFTVRDAALTSTPATIAITVVASGGVPTAVGDQLVVLKGGTSSILTSGATSILANDSSNGGGALSAVLRQGTSYGALSLQANGTFSYRHFGGPETADSFRYVASNSAGQSAETVVNVRPFGITGVQPTGTDTEIDFLVASGLTYRVEFQDTSPSPQSEWETLTSFVANTVGVATVTDETGQTTSRRFYRVHCLGGHGDLATQPWGRQRFSLSAGKSYVADPFHGSLVRRAKVTSSGANSLVLEGPAWAAGQLQPINGFESHIVMVFMAANGSDIGQWWPVTSHNSQSINLDTSGENLSQSLSTGDTVEVRRLNSIASLFGRSTDAGRLLVPGDLVTVYGDARSSGWTVEYSADANESPGYYVEVGSARSGPFDGTTLTLLPAQGLNCRRNGSTALTAQTAGRVQTTPFIHYLAEGSSWAATAFPVPMALSEAGFIESGWQSDFDAQVVGGEDDLISALGGTEIGLWMHHSAGPSGDSGWYMGLFQFDGLVYGPGIPFRLLLAQRSGPFRWSEPVRW